jgi:hypothetical protein
MPDDSIKIQETSQAHQQAANGISDQLRAVYGEDHDVVPATEKAPGEDLGEELDRVLFDKPGFKRSDKFFGKLLERVKKKNPGAEVKLKDQ